MAAQVQENTSEALNLFNRVVMNKGDTNCAGLGVQTQPPHQAWRVHVSVTNPDSRASQSFGDYRRLRRSEVETKRGNALLQPLRFVNAVDLCSGFMQHLE